MSASPSTNATPNPTTHANVDTAAYPQQRGPKRSAIDASTSSSTSVGASGKQAPRQEQEHEQEQDEESEESEESEADSDVVDEDVDRARREKCVQSVTDRRRFMLLTLSLTEHWCRLLTRNRKNVCMHGGELG